MCERERVCVCACVCVCECVCVCVCVCEWSARKTTCLYFTFEVLCIHFVDRVKHVCSPQSVRYAIEMATTNIMMMMIIIIMCNDEWQE